MSGGERGHRHPAEAEAGPRPKGIERFVAGAYRRRLVVHAMVGFLVLSGLWAWQELPVEAFPDLTNNQAVVVTEAPGLSATEVEQQVTYPIETALMGVPRSQEVRSLS
ncbi:MAG: efflux RND transporter permease subunit [Thermoanaerobaculia bacterium]|nr:efflux RND transporter permease subunit [Thermoanaerobaculia bacterium]